jgi:hypothetical protein
MHVSAISAHAPVFPPVDQLEWYCGFVPPAHRGVDAGGTAIDLHDARQKFEAAWRNLRTAFTDDDFAEYRYARAWTAWKQECGRTAASCRRKRRMAARDASAA